MPTKTPKVCVLKADGTNCDLETKEAFELAGADCELVHVKALRSGLSDLRRFQIMAISGGFSYGDDVASGKILAVELLSTLREQLKEFVSAGKLIIGICNGFQVLVRTGLLPFSELGLMRATLAHNNSGQFQCKWVDMAVQPSPCVFTKELEGQVVQFQMAHGEGRFFAEASKLELMEHSRLIPLRYLDNPNGSVNDIAGVCDPSGRIFGLMPHPERFVRREQYVNWRRIPNLTPHGLPFFENGVRFAAENLM